LLGTSSTATFTSNDTIRATTAFEPAASMDVFVVLFALTVVVAMVFCAAAVFIR
jgi:hypothetical protein